jgi:ACS family D-galactonate transporter-like MFS transporter
MIALCFSATAFSYVDRATLAVGAPFIQRDLGIDSATMGILLSGFFWTYALMQLPFGWLIDRVGPRFIYAAAVIWWSIFTALTGVVSGAASIFGTRLALGVGEAACYPANTKVAALWFPIRERGLAAGIFDSGSRAGSALALPLIAGLVGTYGWRKSFLMVGCLGVLWTIVWLVLYRDPARHPRIDSAQLSLLRSTQPKSAPSAPMQWSALFRYRTVWGMMLGFFCLNFVFYFFITWFPSYLVNVRGFSLRELGSLGMLPALAAIPSEWIGGWASDKLYRRGWTLTAARKTCLVGGLLCASLICCAAFTPGIALTLTLFTLACSGAAFAAANVWSMPGDVAPSSQLVGSIAGIQNAAANMAGVITSTFTGLMLQITGGSYIIPLLATGGLCIIGALSYLFIVGPIEPLPRLPRMPNDHA